MVDGLGRSDRSSYCFDCKVFGKRSVVVLVTSEGFIWWCKACTLVGTAEDFHDNGKRLS